MGLMWLADESTVNGFTNALPTYRGASVRPRGQGIWEQDHSKIDGF